MARDDLLAAFVLGRNVSRDGTLIGTLVQHACEAIIFATVAGNFGQFSPETLDHLDALLTQQSKRALPALPIYTASTRLSATEVF